MTWGLALITFLAPGLAIAVLTRSRAPLETTLIGAYVVLHSVVLALQLLGLPLTAGNALAGLAAVTIALVAVAATRGYPWPRGWVPAGPAWGWMPAGASLLALATRSSVQALNGMDVPFRWGYLAECMVELRSLDFYPPLTAADFLVYGFPDGMSPLVASGYWYVWAWAGTDARLAAPLVGLQWVALCAIAWRLGARLGGGPVAGAWAGALAGSAPFLADVVGHGQEVGLIALSALTASYVVMLASTDAPPAERACAASEAGLALAVTALAREYGAAFLVPVLVAAHRGGAARRDLLLTTAVVALLAGPWYLRNLVRTGKPFYDLPTGPLFPDVTIYPAMVRSDAAWLGWTWQPLQKVGTALREALARAPLLVLVGLPALVRPAARPLVLAAGLSAALWAHSVKYTAGGLAYSMRVLAPAMTILAVAGGAAAAAWAPGLRKVLGALIVASTMWGAAWVLAAPRRPESLAAGEWVGHVLGRRGPLRPVSWGWRTELPRVLPAGARILGVTPNPYLGPGLRGTGYEVVPFWSPEVAFLFDESVGYAEAQARLAALGIVACHGWGPLPPFLSSFRFFTEGSAHVVPLAVLGRDRLVALVPPGGDRRAPLATER